MDKNDKKPFTTICFLYIGAVVTQRVGSYITSLLSDNVVMHKLGENLTGLIYVLVVISLWKLWSRIEWFSIRGITRGYLFILPAAYISVNIGDLYPHTELDLYLGFSSRLATGFLEELLCRGMVLALLIDYYQKKSETHYLLKSALISSVLFGIAHFANVIEHPDSIGAITGQVVYATFIGVGFAAVYLQTRSLFPLILIHFAIDFVSFLTKSPGAADAQTFMDTLPAIVICLPLLIYGMILLNKKQQTKIESSYMLESGTA